MHYGVTSASLDVDKAIAWEADFLLHAEAKASGTCAKVARYSTRSVDDEVNRIVSEEGFLMGISIGVILIYMSITLGTWGPVTGRIGLGMSSMLVVNLAIGAAFGLSGFFGIPLTSISGMVVFVVAGIGVDDIFILVECMDRQPKSLPLDERLGLALASAGPAVFLTSVTNMLAFVVSSFVDFPAVQYFVITCGFAIFAVFLLSVTLFSAFMVLDEQRQMDGRRDVLCWKQVDGAGADSSTEGTTAEDDAAQAESRAISPAVEKVIDTILLPPVSGAAIALLAVVAALGFSCVTDLTIGLDLEDTMPDGSYVSEYMMGVQDHWGEVQPPVDLIISGGALGDAAVRQKIFGMVASLVADPFVTEWPCWLVAYDSWALNQTSSGSVSFAASLTSWLDTPAITLSSGLTLVPKQQTSNIVFDGGAVKAVRFIGKVGMPNDRNERFKSLAALRKIVNDNSASSALGPGSTAFVYSYSYIFVDRDEITTHIMFENLGLAGLTVTVCLMLLLHPGVAMAIAVCIHFIDGCLVGLLYVWDVPLDASSFIALTVSTIYLSVHWWWNSGIQARREVATILTMR
jgi:hypothetical protein